METTITILAWIGLASVTLLSLVTLFIWLSWVADKLPDAIAVHVAGWITVLWFVSHLLWVIRGEDDINRNAAIFLTHRWELFKQRCPEVYAAWERLQ